MEKFVFILGSNWKLSLAELDACLKSEMFKGRIVDYSSNIAIVEFKTLKDDQYFINKLETLQYYLGGTQKIGLIYDFVPSFIIENAFPQRIDDFNDVKKARDSINHMLESILEKVFPTIKNEDIFFAVSIYPDLFDSNYYKDVLVKHFLPYLNKNISSILKDKKADKAIYFRYPEKNIKSGNLNPIFPHHVIKYELFKPNRAEILFGLTEEGCYISRTFTSDDPNFKRKIDEERPKKDFKSSISPKLAIMMLNFLNYFKDRHEKNILDPFVGNGTIPLFGIIEDFQVYGADKDKEKVQNTIENIRWLQNELELPPIPNLNSRFRKVEVDNLSNYFENNFFDGIATEPHLSSYYVEKPYYTQALEEFEDEIKPLYDNIFRESYKVLKPNGRICITAPSIKILDDSQDLRLNIERIANDNRFKVIPLIKSTRITQKSNQKLQFRKNQLNSILDAKKDQITRRKIYIFQKKS